MKRTVVLTCIVLLALTACQTASAPPTELPTEQAEEAPPEEPTATPLPPTETPRPTLEPLPEDRIGRMLLVFGSMVQDSYYRHPRSVFMDADYQVVVGSNTLDPFRTASDQEMHADIVLEDVVVSDYDAILFLGDMDITFGGGRPETDRIVQEAHEQGIVLGGICGGVRVLALAGILEGVEIASSEAICQEVQDNFGAICTSEAVRRSGLIVTGTPSGARGVATAIVEILQE